MMEVFVITFVSVLTCTLFKINNWQTVFTGCLYSWSQLTTPYDVQAHLAIEGMKTVVSVHDILT
jgi:hypothetical protein